MRAAHYGLFNASDSGDHEGMRPPRELFVVMCEKCGIVTTNMVRAIADDAAKTHRSTHYYSDKACVTVSAYEETRTW
jgi:hypothetical protein